MDIKLFKQNALTDESGKAFVFSAKDMAIYAANQAISICDYAFFAINGEKTYRFCSNTTDERFVKKPKFALGVTFGSAGTMFFQKTPNKPVIQPEFSVLILYHNTPAHAADIIVYSKIRGICTKQMVITIAETSATALTMEQLLNLTEKYNPPAKDNSKETSERQFYEAPPVVIKIGDIDTENEEDTNETA